MDDSKDFLSHLGGSFSKLLSYALLDLFPSAQLDYEWADQDHFAYQIALKEKIDHVDLKIIEEHMMRVSKSDIETKVMEMVPSNASELFKAHDQVKRAQKLAQFKKPIVEVLQMNHFYDVLRFSFQIKDLECPFKLLSYRIDPVKKTLFVQGVAGKTKDQLKKSVKDFQKWQKKSFEKLNQGELFFKNDLYMPKAQTLIDQLKNIIEGGYLKNKFEKIGIQTSFKSLKTFFESRKIDEGKYFLWDQRTENQPNLLLPFAFQIKNHTFDHSIQFINCPDIVQECISCLNFYRQIIKILGFSYRIMVKANLARSSDRELVRALEPLEVIIEEEDAKSIEISFYLRDAYGRSLFRPSIRVQPNRIDGQLKGYTLEGTFCHSIEMLMVQLLEQGEENMLKSVTL